MTSRLGSILLLGLVAAVFAGCGGDTRRGEAERTEATTRPSAVQTPESSQPPSGDRCGWRRSPIRFAAPTSAGRRGLRRDRPRAREGAGEGRNRHGPAEAVKAYEGTIALGWRELREIEAIAEPPGERRLLRANVFDPIRGQLALKAKIRDALAAADVPLLRRLRSELDNSIRALAGFARGYGFGVCGEE